MARSRSTGSSGSRNCAVTNGRLTVAVLRFGFSSGAAASLDACGGLSVVVAAPPPNLGDENQNRTPFDGQRRRSRAGGGRQLVVVASRQHPAWQERGLGSDRMPASVWDRLRERITVGVRDVRSAPALQ